MNRQLEIGKTYYSTSGATISVTRRESDGDFLADVTNDKHTVASEAHKNMFYRPDGTCYGVVRLNVDWDHPDNNEQGVKDMEYDIKNMKLIFNVKKKPELAKAITERLRKLGAQDYYTTWDSGIVNISLSWRDPGTIHFGAAEVEDEMWTGYRLTTLDDLYNLEAWAKPKTIDLPSTPSELLRLAINDLEKVEAMPDKYKVYMSSWHVPKSSLQCYVCFAGSVMAQTLHADPTKSFSPAEFGTNNALKLAALDDFRVGNLNSALRRLDIDLDVILPPVFVTSYRADPDLFKRQMREIATWLEMIDH